MYKYGMPKICSILCAILLSMPSLAIASSETPDLKRIFSFSTAKHFTTPVVVIHGAFGARIRNTKGEEIWPGTQTNLLFSNYDDLALHIDPKTLNPQASNSEPYALFGKIGSHDFYGKIIDTLAHAGGYTPAKIGEPILKDSHAYYVFIYDWRQDIAFNAKKLDAFIEQIRTDYNDKNLKVDIVAHSLGGLIARYYVRYGGKDVLTKHTFHPDFAGGKKLRKVVLIGTPNLGSISGLQNILTGYRLGLGRISSETLLTMPSAYQLLPNPERNWMITPSGKKAGVKLYNPNTWEKFHWAIFDPNVQKHIRHQFKNKVKSKLYIEKLKRFFIHQLARAKQFHKALSVPIKGSPVHYIVFGGDCELTPARCLIETVQGKTMIRLHPENIKTRVKGVNYKKLMLEPGDGSVTKPSLLALNALDPSNIKTSSMPLAYSMFLCEEHSQLTGNISFQDNLLNILLLQETTEDRILSKDF